MEDALCDLVLIQNYINPNKLFSAPSKNSNNNKPKVFGNVYYPNIAYNLDMNKQNKREINKLQNYFMHYDSLDSFSGYFVESYNDWIGEVPSFYSIFDSAKQFIYPFGLVNIKRNKKDKYHFFANYLKNNPIEVSYYKSEQKNNFYSIMVFTVWPSYSF